MIDTTKIDKINRGAKKGHIVSLLTRKKIALSNSGKISSRRKIIKYVWQGSCKICVSHKGIYPQVNRIVDGKSIKGLHRIVFYKKYHYLPEVVMHTCDNKRCANINHLKAGTYSENYRDMLDKKIWGFGVKNGNHKLSEAQVLEIRQRLKHKVRGDMVRISHEFNISRDLVHKIYHNKLWKHISID